MVRDIEDDMSPRRADETGSHAVHMITKRRAADRRLWLGAAALFSLTFAGGLYGLGLGGAGAGPATADPSETAWQDRVMGFTAATSEEAPTNVYYSGCRAVRAAGRAPLYRDQPGYRVEMDGDRDGIACEPHISHIME